MDCTIVAVVNQKGGVAKTTSVVNIGAALVEQGARVLLVDLDPQASLTFSVGLDPEGQQTGTHEAMMGRTAEGHIVSLVDDGAGATCDVLPANVELSATESELSQAEDKFTCLATALASQRSHYDVILIDCSPTLGLLTVNALAAADEVIVPVTCDMLSHRGVGQLLHTVADVRELVNPKLSVRGLLPTMYDQRLAHARAVLADLRERFDVPVMTPIPRSVRFAEAPAVGQSVLSSAPKSAGAQAYRDLGAQLAEQWGITRRSRP